MSVSTILKNGKIDSVYIPDDVQGHSQGSIFEKQLDLTTSLDSGINLKTLTKNWNDDITYDDVKGGNANGVSNPLQLSNFSIDSKMFSNFTKFKFRISGNINIAIISSQGETHITSISRFYSSIFGMVFNSSGELGSGAQGVITLIGIKYGSSGNSSTSFGEAVNERFELEYEYDGTLSGDYYVNLYLNSFYSIPNVTIQPALYVVKKGNTQTGGEGSSTVLYPSPSENNFRIQIIPIS
jgi:hypothetical protein